jgi:putative ABC transport system substrate-binding protein
MGGGHMRRRDLISTALLGATAVVWPRRASAQKKVPRVGVLLNGASAASDDLALVRELARIGYIEGRNVSYEIRAAAGNPGRLPQLAGQLVAAKPDVIVGSATQAANALFGATREIPIVMTVIGDPIALGLTESISHPTYNLTGFTLSSLSLAAKRLEVLQSIVPALHKAAYVWVPENPLSALFEAHVRKAADALGVKLVSLPLKSDKDVADFLPERTKSR